MPINVTMSAVYRGEEEEGVCGCSLLVEQGVGHPGGYAGVLGTRVFEVADVLRPLLLCEHVNQLWRGAGPQSSLCYCYTGCGNQHTALTIRSLTNKSSASGSFCRLRLAEMVDLVNSAHTDRHTDRQTHRQTDG